MDEKFKEIIDQLQSVIEQMKSGQFSPIRQAILLTRNAEIGYDFVTICNWGDETGLLQEAAELKRESETHGCIVNVN